MQSYLLIFFILFDCPTLPNAWKFYIFREERKLLWSSESYLFQECLITYIYVNKLDSIAERGFLTSQNLQSKFKHNITHFEVEKFLNITH